MSIFKKISLLFLLSFILMLSIGYQIDKINTERLEMLVIQKYMQDAKKVFRLMATLPPDALNEQLTSLHLEHYELRDPSTVETLNVQPHSFGELSILKNEGGDYLLSIRYFDETLVLIDQKLQNELGDQWLLNILVVVDIAVLVLIFVILIKILSPLKELSMKMKGFALGNFKNRATVRGDDEIAEVGRTYNQMAQNIESLILSRQELLRDIGHELRTPISRGLFALEKMEPSSSKTVLEKSLSELERLTSELLEIEKLQVTQILQMERFEAETLVIEALSRLIIEDESKVAVIIEDNFAVHGNLNYLALALKNLIDNALKYATVFPITVTLSENMITVSNQGEPLKNDIAHYLHPFTREESSREPEGFGLGLSIVTKVLSRHGFELEYRFRAQWHHFSIRFKKGQAVW